MAPQVFFITGTSLGFGNELVQYALSKGDKVVATSRNASKLSFPEVKNKENLLTVDCDVTSKKSVDAAFAKALERFGRVDVVVNNAGYGLSGIFESITEEQARKQIDVNAIGVMFVTQAALAIMRDHNKPQGGKILQITSVGATIGVPTFSIYCFTKWGIEGMSEAITKEIKPEWNIHLTNVEPGGFRTEWAGSSMEFATQHPSYDHMNAKERMQARHGTQAGDPAKGARAFYEVAMMDKPPMRIAIGSDAYSVVTNKIKEYSEQYPKYEKISNSTDVDGYQRPS